MGCTGDLPLVEQLHVVFHSLDETKLTHFLWVTYMQPARMHFKNQIWQSKFSTVDHKCCVHFTIISHSVDLDQILETDDVGNSFLAKPYPEFVSGQLAFLRDPETSAIARHINRLTAIGFWREPKNSRKTQESPPW